MLHHITSWKSGPPRGRWAVFVCLLLPFWGWGQVNNSGPKLQFSGRVRLNTDFSAQNRPDLNGFGPNRPGVLCRTLFDGKLSAGRFSMPMHMVVTLPAGGVGLNRLQKPSLRDFLLMRNNWFEFQPTFGDLTIFLNSHRASVSRLTAGDIPYITGSGFRWVMDDLSVEAHYGLIQQGFARDTAIGRLGQFEQKMLVLHAGLGDEKHGFIRANYVRVKEDSVASGIPFQIDRQQPPSDGTVLGIESLRIINKHLSARGEVAMSVFSSDVRSDTINLGRYERNVQNLLRWLSKYSLVNESARIGTAAEGMVKYLRKHLELAGIGKYTSSGFQSLAFRNLPTGLLDISANGKLKLLKGRWKLQGNGGQRFNNVSGTVSESFNRFYYNVSSQMVVRKSLNLDVDYFRYGLRTVILDSVERLQALSHSLAIHPSITFGDQMFHLLTLDYNRDQYNEYDVYSGTGGLVSSEALGLFYHLNIPKKLSLTMTIRGTVFTSGGPELARGQTRQFNASLSLQQAYWKGRLNATTQLQFLHSESLFSPLRRVFSLSTSANLNLTKQLALTAKINGQMLGITQGQSLVNQLRLNASNAISFQF